MFIVPVSNFVYCSVVSDDDNRTTSRSDLDNNSILPDEDITYRSYYYYYYYCVVLPQGLVSDPPSNYITIICPPECSSTNEMK